MNNWVLLAPAGLIALAGLAVPLLIHLLSRSRGQRVLVGNIELFRQVRRQRASQIRLVQWLLLALRLLMLLLAALLLAELARQGMAQPEANTAYVTPARLAAAERGEAPIPADHDNLVSLTGGWPQLAEALALQPPANEVAVYTLASAGDQPARPLALPAPVTWVSDGVAAPRAPATLNVLIAHEPQTLARRTGPGGRPPGGGGIPPTGGLRPARGSRDGHPARGRPGAPARADLAKHSAGSRGQPGR